MNSLQQQLIVEIEFWREMIEQQEMPFPPASLERMKQAQALAEHKLLRLGLCMDDLADRQSESNDMTPISGPDRRH